MNGILLVLLEIVYNDSMSKTIGFIILVIVIIIVAIFVLKGRGGNETTPGTSVSSDAVSMKELIGRGSPVWCTLTNTAEVSGGSGSGGAIYIAPPDRVRADFATTGTPEGTVFSHFIVRDGTSYVWTDSSRQGFKTTSEVSSDDSGSVYKAVDFDEKVDYQCRPWTPNSSLFELPSEITFTDLQAMMNQFQQ
jgi:hypothetical protein